MKYWVYENWTHDKALVHKEDCRFCRYGKGLHDFVASGENDIWHGPFNVYVDAMDVARKTRLGTVRACGICKPG